VSAKAAVVQNVHKGENHWTKSPCLLALTLLAAFHSLQAQELSSVSAAAVPPHIASFTLINSDTDQPVPGYELLCDGAVIDLSAIATTHFNIRANPGSTGIGSVRFVLDDFVHVENYEPYALFANSGPNYFTRNLAVGDHRLSATPFTEDNTNGTAGTTYHIAFSVVRHQPSPTPTPTPRPTPTPTPTPDPTPDPTPTPTPTPTPVTSVTLAWRASRSTDVTGYRIFYGLSSGNYTQQMDAGNKTSATVSGLSGNKTYYFVATAYNSDGLQSEASNEVSFTTSTSSSATSAAATSATTTLAGGGANAGEGTATASPSGSTAPMRHASVPALNSLSTRIHIRSSNDVESAGFAISGSGQKTVVVRALGPSLTRFGVSGTLADPSLELRDSRGNIIATNDNWNQSQHVLFAAGGQFHALQPANDLESAIAITLPPGLYTATVRGKTGTTGVAVAEIYDFSQDSDSKLTSISTRANVQNGDNAIVGGLTIGGSTKSRLIIRAIGPSLSRYGMNNSLVDAALILYDSNGTVLRVSSSWRDNPAEATQILNSGYAPGDVREPAMLVTLPAGNYTAAVRGRSNGTGVALLEVYTLN
jgi:hypothetical protein